jgi:hypothetical protein
MSLNEIENSFGFWVLWVLSSREDLTSRFAVFGL